MNELLKNRLNAPGPKRILSLDGGGIRGILSLGYLKKIEELIRKRHNQPDMVLADYFDFIGGTSTGSIIGTALAIGMTVDEIKTLYLTLSDEIFKPRIWINRYLGFASSLFGAQYSVEALDRHLTLLFGDRTLGDESIQTGMCIFTKRADTRSTWPFINHPDAKYYKYNSPYLISSLIRASTAAPTKFEPEMLQISEDLKGAFVDGGLGNANNPALYMFLIATLKCFPFHWQTGADDILLVSIGTGWSQYETQPNTVMKKRAIGWLSNVMDFLMQDSSEMNQIVLQAMARTPQPTYIDGEMGDLKDENLSGRHLLHYLRYNVQLEAEYMDAVGLSKYNKDLIHLHSIEDPRNAPKLLEITQAFAAAGIQDDHFPDSFDLPLKS